MYTVKILALSAVLAAVINLDGAQAGRCGPDEYEQDIGHNSYCFKIMSAEPVTQIESMHICFNNAMSVYYAVTMDALNIIAETAKLAGFPTSEEGPGVWLPFKRKDAVPVGTPDYENLRATLPYDNLFIDPVGGVHYIPGGFSQDLWRKADAASGEPRDQPGDKLDERDEQCVVLKNINAPESGLDSFSCDPGPNGNYMMHYAICSRGQR